MSSNNQNQNNQEQQQLQRSTMKSFVKTYILQRQADCDINPELKHGSNRITQTDVFYDLRKPMEEAGWEKDGWNHPKKKRRKQVIAYIKEVCDELGIKRSDIGIIAGESAHMYFRGKRQSVGIDDLKKLKAQGTDILFIEKEGIAEQLSDLAAFYGIALVHGRGFMTEYATELAELAASDGGNLAVLTDFDVSGFLIAAKMTKEGDTGAITHIGVNFQTLIDLGIPPEQWSDLEEIYTPDNGHLKHLIENFPDTKNLEYLKSHRIEINAVRKHVGTKRLWEWIVSKLESVFISRDYNRAIEMPSALDFAPPVLYKLNNIVSQRIESVLTYLIKERQEELSEYYGFIADVDAYERDMNREFRVKIAENADLDSLTKDIAKVIAKYNGHDNNGTTRRAGKKKKS